MFISLLVPIGIIALILFLFSSMKNVSIMRLYLALAAFVGLIGAIIGYGTFGYEYAKSQIITDEEYISGQRGYEIKSCEDPNYMPTTKVGTGETVKKTDAEIAKCKEEARTRLIAERRYQLKDSAIGGGVWGTLFALVFVIHFPIFLRSSRKED